MSNDHFKQEGGDLRKQEMELIKRILGGDVNAFGIFVVRYQNRIHNFLIRKGGYRNDLDEIVQNAFILAYENLHKFKGNSSFYTWVCTIATRQMINANEKQARASLVTYEHHMNDSEDSGDRHYADSHVSNDLNYEETLISQERLKLIEYVMSRIPEEFKKPLLLMAEKGLSYSAIAKRLNLTEATVRTRVNRGRAEFKRLLAKYENEIF